MSRVLRLALAATVVALAVAPTAAEAAWLSHGAARATVNATTLNKAGTPVATKTAPTVTISWAATTLASGASVGGYEVRRHSGSGYTVVCTTASPSVRSCQDPAPLMGQVTYGVVARSGANWVSQESDPLSFQYDTTAPVTTPGQSPATNADGWNNATTTVTLPATDAESGVKSISYSVNGGSPTTVTGATATVPVSAEGTTTIGYAATDNVGNTETTKTYSVKLDKTAPTATASGNPSANSAGYNFTPVTVTIGATDALSGVRSVSYQLGTGQVLTTQGSSASVTVSAQGTMSIQYWATDVAGNDSTHQNYTVNITSDTTPPTQPMFTDPQGGITYKNNPGHNGWLANCANAGGICGTASDPGSGVASVTFILTDTATNTCWTGTAGNYSAAACSQPITANGTTSWSYAVPFAAIAGRDVSLTVTARDVVGLASSASTGTFSGR